MRARIFKALEVSFLSPYIFQEYQDKCSSAINEVIIYLLSKKSYFFTKSARARALLLRSVQNQKMHVIYIILSSHAKNQPPRTMLSYVYTLFKFPGEKYVLCHPLHIPLICRYCFFIIIIESYGISNHILNKNISIGLDSHFICICFGFILFYFILIDFYFILIDFI